MSERKIYSNENENENENYSESSSEETSEEDEMKEFERAYDIINDENFNDEDYDFDELFIFYRNAFDYLSIKHDDFQQQAKQIITELKDDYKSLSAEKIRIEQKYRQEVFEKTEFCRKYESLRKDFLEMTSDLEKTQESLKKTQEQADYYMNEANRLQALETENIELKTKEHYRTTTTQFTAVFDFELQNGRVVNIKPRETFDESNDEKRRMIADLRNEIVDVKSKIIEIQKAKERSELEKKEITEEKEKLKVEIDKLKNENKERKEQNEQINKEKLDKENELEKLRQQNEQYKLDLLNSQSLTTTKRASVPLPVQINTTNQLNESKVPLPNKNANQTKMNQNMLTQSIMKADMFINNAYDKQQRKKFPQNNLLASQRVALPKNKNPNQIDFPKQPEINLDKPENEEDFLLKKSEIIQQSMESTPKKSNISNPMTDLKLTSKEKPKKLNKTSTGSIPTAKQLFGSALFSPSPDIKDHKNKKVTKTKSESKILSPRSIFSLKRLDKKGINKNKTFSQEYLDGSVMKYQTSNRIIQSIDVSLTDCYMIMYDDNKPEKEAFSFVQKHPEIDEEIPILVNIDHASQMIETEDYLVLRYGDLLLYILFESLIRKQQQFSDFKMFIRGNKKIYVMNSKQELYYFNGESLVKSYTLYVNVNETAFIVDDIYLFFIENNRLKRYDLQTQQLFEQPFQKPVHMFSIINNTIFIIDTKLREISRCDFNFIIQKGSKFLMSPPRSIKTLGNIVCVICHDLFELFDEYGTSIFKFDLKQKAMISNISYCNVKDGHKHRLMMTLDKKKIYFVNTGKQIHSIVDGGHGICSVCQQLSHEVKCSKCGKCFHYRCIKNTPRSFEPCLLQKK